MSVWAQTIFDKAVQVVPTKSAYAEVKNNSIRKWLQEMAVESDAEGCWKCDNMHPMTLAKKVKAEHQLHVYHTAFVCALLFGVSNVEITAASFVLRAGKTIYTMILFAAVVPHCSGLWQVTNAAA